MTAREFRASASGAREVAVSGLSKLVCRSSDGNPLKADKLRGHDVVALKVEDIAPNGYAIEPDRCGGPASNAVVASSHRGRKSTFRDSISVPQLVFLPRAAITGSAAIFLPCWMMKAS
jgi:hypothetical protein